MEDEQFRSYQAEVRGIGHDDDGREKAQLSAEDQLKLERAASCNAMVYIQQYIKSQSLLQALQMQLTEYQDLLKKSHLEQLREEKRERTFTPDRIEELREVVSFFCPKDPETLIGKAWIAYHMHSAHAEPVANPGLLLKRSKKDDMIAVWRAHGLNLFEKSTRRDATGFAFNISCLPVARRMMLDMRARGLDCACKNPRKRKRMSQQPQHEPQLHHEHHHQPQEHIQHVQHAQHHHEHAQGEHSQLHHEHEHEQQLVQHHHLEHAEAQRHNAPLQHGERNSRQSNGHSHGVHEMAQRPLQRDVQQGHHQHQQLQQQQQGEVGHEQDRRRQRRQQQQQQQQQQQLDDRHLHEDDVEEVHRRSHEQARMRLEGAHQQGTVHLHPESEDDIHGNGETPVHVKDKSGARLLHQSPVGLNMVLDGALGSQKGDAVLTQEFTELLGGGDGIGADGEPHLTILPE